MKKDATAPHGSEDAANQRTHHRILLVDGNEKQRYSINTLLRVKLGYEVSDAVDGQDALAKCANRTYGFDLVLVDMSTIENGLSVVMELRNQNAEALIVVLVQYGEYQAAAEALLLGAHDFMTKPVVEERIRVTLRNALALRDARRAARRASASVPEGAGKRRSDSHAEGTVISLIDSDGDAKKIKEIELAAIQFAVRFYNGRMTEVARKLGIGRSTLYRKLGAVG